MLREPEKGDTEKDISLDLEERLNALQSAARCEWHKEVRMQCYTHSLRGKPDALRIDYVAKIDGILVGFEVKKTPEKAADLGRYLLQCAQYAHGTIGASTSDRINVEWIGQAMLAVFLVTSNHLAGDYVLTHGRAAHRLFGPANVGFFNRDCRHADCFDLRLCGGRIWSKEGGWHRGMVNKSARVGNGSFQAANVDDVTFPDGEAFDFPFETSRDYRWW